VNLTLSILPSYIRPLYVNATHVRVSRPGALRLAVAELYLFSGAVPAPSSSDSSGGSSDSSAAAATAAAAGASTATNHALLGVLTSSDPHSGEVWAPAPLSMAVDGNERNYVEVWMGGSTPFTEPLVGAADSTPGAYGPWIELALGAPVEASSASVLLRSDCLLGGLASPCLGDLGGVVLRG
jgi:hypothetical protein